MYFNNKVSVVTGAASGFGLAFTKRLLKEGAKAVYMGDFNERLLKEEAQKLIKKYPNKVFYMVSDSMKYEDVKALIEYANNNSGSVDFLFNNAGKPLTKPTKYISIKEFEDLIKLNFNGVMYGTLIALEIMEKQGSGHIINTASMAGLIPGVFQAAYSSTKSAVITLTRCLSYEYIEKNINFSFLAPMNVKTNIFSVQFGDELRKKGKSEEEIQKAIKEITPPGNAMDLEEAIDYTFEKIANKEVEIIFGEDGRQINKMFNCDREMFDKDMYKVFKKRQKYFDDIIAGKNPIFPG